VLLAVNDANLTGNYTVLHDLSAPDSQGLNTPERLEESFRPIRQQGIDFSIVAVAQPQFSQLPAFTPQGYLRRNGEFTGSSRITFDIFLEPNRRSLAAVYHWCRGGAGSCQRSSISESEVCSITEREVSSRRLARITPRDPASICAPSRMPAK